MEEGQGEEREEEREGREERGRGGEETREKVRKRKGT